MQALYIEQHGPFENLRATEIPTPSVGPGEVLVEVQAAGVNPSDIVSAEGRFPQAVLPRVLGRDFAGKVVQGPSDLLGAQVWGSGGDLGITRNGTHAEFVALPRDAVALRPKNISVEEAAVAGVPFVTAWISSVEYGRLQKDEYVIVSGAAGAVGLAATEIALERGARVVALVLDEQEAERLDKSRLAGIARSDLNNLVDVVKAVTAGRGADLALNGVGAPIFQHLFDSLAPAGRMVVYSAVAGREVTLDLFMLYRKRMQVFGIDTSVADAVECAGILAKLTPLFETGRIRPLPVFERYPLSQAAQAYARAKQTPPGKIVLIPDKRYRT